jgi:hypothetical protein
MDIIFQSDEFYSAGSSLIKVLGSILGALISGIVAIGIFKKGLKEQSISVKKVNNEKYDELENYCFSVIKYLNQAIGEQLNLLELGSKKLLNFSQSNLLLQIFSQLSTDEIDSINNVDLYKIFVSNRDGETSTKTSNYLNLKSCLRFLNQQKEAYNDFNQKLHTELEKHRNTWNTNLKNLLDLYNSFEIQKLNSLIKPADDIFLNAYRKIIVDKQRLLIQ